MVTHSVPILLGTEENALGKILIKGHIMLGKIVSTDQLFCPHFT